MTLKHRENLDQITQATSELRQKGKDGLTKGVSREKSLGLKFEKGIVIKDSITGKEGEILGGTRTTVGLPITRD
jgi:hypothetical protein